MLPKEIVFTIRPRDIVGILLVSPLAVLVAWWIFNWPWESPNAPAWVQAVGSIAAILVSVWIPNAKDRRDERKAKEKIALLQKGISHTAKTARDFAEVLLDRLQNPERLSAIDWDQVNRTCAGYYEQLEKCSPADFHDDQVAIAYRCLWGAVRDAHADINPSASAHLSEDFLSKVHHRCKLIIKASNFWFETVQSDYRSSRTSPSGSTGESESSSREATSQ
ncbi:hypothetical protein D3C76_936460 [compost metagenome]